MVKICFCFLACFIFAEKCQPCHIKFVYKSNPNSVNGLHWTKIIIFETSKEFILTFCEHTFLSVCVHHWWKLQHKYCAHFWAPYCKKDIELLKHVQRSKVGEGKGIQRDTGIQRELEFFSLDKRTLRRKFITLELPERWLQQGRLLSLFHGNNWWDQGNSLKKAGLYWSKEVFLQKEGGWTLQQAAQGSSGFPITAVI